MTCMDNFIMMDTIYYAS